MGIRKICPNGIKWSATISISTGTIYWKWFDFHKAIDAIFKPTTSVISIIKNHFRVYIAFWISLSDFLLDIFFARCRFLILHINRIMEITKIKAPRLVVWKDDSFAKWRLTDAKKNVIEINQIIPPARQICAERPWCMELLFIFYLKLCEVNLWLIKLGVQYDYSNESRAHLNVVPPSYIDIMIVIVISGLIPCCKIVPTIAYMREFISIIIV